jgi:sporulation protein YlmC with PRC-barrel domain
MKKVTTTLVASLAMFALASPLYATNEKNMTTNTQQQAGVSKSQSAEGIKGFEVYSQTGEKIGEITDVRSDKQSGAVQFVTFTKGGVMGIGGKDTAVPLGAFKLDRENQRATLTVSEDKLNNGPAQAGKSDKDFQRELSSHYGIAPVWEEKSKAGEAQVPNPSPGLETGSPQMQNKSK